jgi:hypothetical protein
MPSRWELLLEQQPVPLIDHLVEELSKLLANELSRWPPDIAELDVASGASFAPLLEEGYPRPAKAAYAEAFRLARFELEHDLDAYDDYMRNQRWAEHGLPPGAKQELLFLSRWLTEQMFALGEVTQGRVKRRHMREILDRAERRLLAPQA